MWKSKKAKFWWSVGVGLLPLLTASTSLASDRVLNLRTQKEGKSALCTSWGFCTTLMVETTAYERADEAAKDELTDKCENGKGGIAQGDSYKSDQLGCSQYGRDVICHVNATLKCTLPDQDSRISTNTSKVSAIQDALSETTIECVRKIKIGTDLMCVDSNDHVTSKVGSAQ